MIHNDPSQHEQFDALVAAEHVVSGTWHDGVVLIDVDTSLQTQTISIIYVAQETGQIGQKENIFYLSTESVSMSCRDD